MLNNIITVLAFQLYLATLALAAPVATTTTTTMTL